MKMIQVKDEALPLLAKAMRDEVARRREAARPFVNDSSPGAQARRRAAALLEEVAEAAEAAR
jgi:hypothetical protein